MTDERILELHRMAQSALELELFTIPPYLTALYSIREGHNREAAELIQSVVMEEMLHVTLVANIMNAIGAQPSLSPELTNQRKAKRQVKLKKVHYPAPIPHIKPTTPLEVSLLRFSREAVETFQTIEQPEQWGAPTGETYTTIGQFYEAFTDKLVSASADLGEDSVFSGNKEDQICPDTHYYGAGGKVIAVCELAHAREAIEQVAEQGEGRSEISNLSGNRERFGQPKEVAHYFRFTEILAGQRYQHDDNVSEDPTGPPLRVDWDAVHPMQPNPRTGADEPSGIAELKKAFDNRYTSVLKSLHRGFNGKPSELEKAIGDMHALKHQATALMKVSAGENETHGPPFWFVSSAC